MISLYIPFIQFIYGIYSFITTCNIFADYVSFEYFICIYEYNDIHFLTFINFYICKWILWFKLEQMNRILTSVTCYSSFSLFLLGRRWPNGMTHALFENVVFVKATNNRNSPA